MALTSTTLAAACTASAVKLTLTSTSGIAAGDFLQIDSEFMRVVSVPASGLVTVRARGDQGTHAVAHDILALVNASATASDFPALAVGQVSPNPPDDFEVLTLGQDTDFTASNLPVRNTEYIIMKATAAAITLDPANAASRPLTLKFVAGTAQAHTLTYTEGFLGDTTSSDVVTFGSKVGANCSITLGKSGLWSLQLGSGCTVA